MSTTNNNNIEINSTPSLIASYSGRKVFGLNDSIPFDNYKKDFYYNIIPFKVKEIISAGGSGEYICYWTTDDRLLFSGYLMSEKEYNYLFKYNLTSEQKVINDKFSNLFEFKWKDFFINKLNITTTSQQHKIKKVYALERGCIIIQFDNNALFYYYLNLDKYGFIPINNVKWIKGGNMSEKVYIYTNCKELFTFKSGNLENVNLDFLQQQQINNKSTKIKNNDSLLNYASNFNKLIRHAAITNSGIDALVTEDNKIYLKTEQTSSYGIIKNTNNTFIYRKTPFQKQSKIIDMKGGFCHFIVLLENGKVYSIGFNNLGQLGFDKSVIKKTHEFKQIILKTREDIFVDKIFVSSRGTVLRTDTEFIFLGEVIEGFTQSFHIPGIEYSYILKREEGNNRKWNEISYGPLSYLVYFKEEGNSKDMEFFLQNLKKAYSVDLLLTHDVEFMFLK